MQIIKLVAIVVSSALLALVGFMLFHKRVNNHRTIQLGVYDPSGKFKNHDEIKIQNIYVAWGEDPEKIKAMIGENALMKRETLITIEPWQANDTDRDGNELLDDISNGKYDNLINSVCEALVASETQTIIRWGHEMELKSRYPWGGMNSSKYKDSYNHFVRMCKLKSNKFKYMWSPAGEQGTQNYWPGSEHVDYIGVSIYSYDQWDLKNIGYQRSFREVLEPKYERIKDYQKPLIIAESGVAGTGEYKKSWILNIAQDVDRFPLLEGFIYFDGIDRPGAWGDDLGVADFSISEEDLEPLYNLLKTNE